MHQLLSAPPRLWLWEGCWASGFSFLRRRRDICVKGRIVSTFQSLWLFGMTSNLLQTSGGKASHEKSELKTHALGTRCCLTQWEGLIQGRGPQNLGAKAAELSVQGTGWGRGRLQMQVPDWGRGGAESHQETQADPRPETHLWTPSTSATSSGEDEMYTQDFPPSGDFLGPSTLSSSFTWTVWQRQRARKNSSSRSYKKAVPRTHKSLCIH